MRFEKAHSAENECGWDDDSQMLGEPSVKQHMRLMNEITVQCLSNRETLLIRFCIEHDRDLNYHWHQVARKTLQRYSKHDARESLSALLESGIREEMSLNSNSLQKESNIATLSKVNWSQLAASLLDDEDESQNENQDEEWPLVDAYSRAQALADGVLVDASKLAAEAGFKYPVALTSAAWAECVTVPDGADDQDEVGRLWDVLNVLLFAIRNKPQSGLTSEVRFTVSVRTGEVTSEDINLKSLCGPGDDAAPVITIMLPDED